MVRNGFRGWEPASVIRQGNRIYNADTRVTTNRLSRCSGKPEPFPSSNLPRYAGRHKASPREPRRVSTTLSVLAHSQGSGFPLRRERRELGLRIPAVARKTGVGTPYSHCGEKDGSWGSVFPLWRERLEWGCAPVQTFPGRGKEDISDTLAAVCNAISLANPKWREHVPQSRCRGRA